MHTDVREIAMWSSLNRVSDQMVGTWVGDVVWGLLVLVHALGLVAFHADMPIMRWL